MLEYYQAVKLKYYHIGILLDLLLCWESTSTQKDSHDSHDSHDNNLFNKKNKL